MSPTQHINSINDKGDPMETVAELSEYFANIGTKLAEKIPPSQIALNYNNIPNVPLLELKEATEQEVSELLFKISDSKATGDDGIPILFIKMTHNVTVKIICHIINLSIRTKTVPSDWKVAIITPLFKEGDRNLASNYRPISILPCLSKIMECIIHNQIYNHLRDHNLLSEAQFTFRKYHSISTCILKLLNTVYRNIDTNVLTGVVFLDLKKAFNTVDHIILLNKLHTFKLSQETINWFRDY